MDEGRIGRNQSYRIRGGSSEGRQVHLHRRNSECGARRVSNMNSKLNLAATILTLLMLHLSVGPSVGAVQTQGLRAGGVAGVSPEVQDSPGWSRQRSSGHSVARLWDEQLLDAIRIDIPKPPAHARNLFHLSVAMWDAWAAYAQIGRA